MLCGGRGTRCSDVLSKGDPHPVTRSVVADSLQHLGSSAPASVFQQRPQKLRRPQPEPRREAEESPAHFCPAWALPEASLPCSSLGTLRYRLAGQPAGRSAPPCSPPSLFMDVSSCALSFVPASASSGNIIRRRRRAKLN